MKDTCRLVCLRYKLMDVSKMHAASISRGMSRPHCSNSGGSTYLWNVAKLTTDNMAIQPTRPPPSRQPRSYLESLRLFIVLAHTAVITFSAVKCADSGRCVSKRRNGKVRDFLTGTIDRIHQCMRHVMSSIYIYSSKKHNVKRRPLWRGGGG
jgi:hypothetical protein